MAVDLLLHITPAPKLLLTIGALLVLAIISFAFRSVANRWSQLPLPPGPAPRFLSGNLHQLPKTLPWLKFDEWSRIYGPVISFRIFRRRIIVLSSSEAAADLLESRSQIYSDRPMLWMLNVLAGRGKAVFNTSFHSPRFRKYRKLLHSGLNPRACQTYRPVQEQETRFLLQGLLKTPDKFLELTRKNTTAVILKVAYGYTVSGDNDVFVSILDGAAIWQSKLLAPGWLVEVFPILRFIPAWFPGAEFRRVAEECGQEMKRIETTPHEWAKREIESGHYVESFSSKHLLPADGPIPDEEERDVIKWCTGALHVGGAETTVSALTSFFLLMSLYPEVQMRAQAEIDAVIGKDRLPNLDDKDKLPYISAVLKELLRWAPVAPRGLPHYTSQEDTYNGFRIPKGSTVLANIWSMSHNPTTYPNPHLFDPERFLGEEQQVDPRKYVFGFGRRICPGAHFAELGVFQIVSNVLATFNIAKAVDNEGRDIEPNYEFTTGVVSYAKNFECKITPRSPEVLALINPPSR